MRSTVLKIEIVRKVYIANIKILILLLFRSENFVMNVYSYSFLSTIGSGL